MIGKSFNEWNTLLHISQPAPTTIYIYYDQHLPHLYLQTEILLGKIVSGSFILYVRWSIMYPSSLDFILNPVMRDWSVHDGQIM